MSEVLQMDGEGPFDDLEGNAAFGRLFRKFLAEQGSELLQNNEFLESVNAAGTGDLSLLKADASDNTVLNALTAKKNSFRVNDVEEGSVDATGLHLPLANGVFLKTGSNGKAGTVTVNGTTPVSVATTGFLAGSVVVFSLKTIGGTVGAIPRIATPTPGTGFTVVGTASDTSVYNWAIIDTE